MFKPAQISYNTHAIRQLPPILDTVLLVVGVGFPYYNHKYHTSILGPLIPQ